MASDSYPSERSTLATGNAPVARVRDPRIGDRVAGRFTLVALLGAGAHGVVYEAEDESSGRPVALKMLARLEPDELYRFKREFRVLADVSDENLVALHELFIDDAGAFFTMELVRGTDFLSYVRGDELDRLDVSRLRHALRQLCQGLSALHGFGKLHRDLKPSNVLVGDDGHVSVADFGLAEELATVASERDLVGTPAYMSPEQAAGLELLPASDWYSVGVMIYEALTGTIPFAGCFGRQMLIAKQGPEPPPPSALVPDVPADLDELCAELLRRDPAGRPTGSQVLARLGRDVSPAWARPALPTAFGRARELACLHDAFAHASAGQPGRAAVLLLHGHSGTGKTTLLEAFVEGLADDAVVLRGRCYERESVPYKGLDALIDELRTHLHRQARRGEARLPVVGATSLARLFPVLGDVTGLGDVFASVPEDPVERRRQAVAALGELLAWLARRGPLVLVLDDLQWCDADTVAILLALLRPRSRPGMLVVGSFRDEEVGARSALTTLREELSRLGDEIRLDVLAVEPLEPTAAHALALHLLGERDDAVALADAIAADAEGSPLFIAELARYVGAGRMLAAERVLTLDDVIRDRAAELPARARVLLELAMLAAGPIEQAILAEAADVEGAPEMLALLRNRCFVRTHGARPVDPVEPFHDRVRTAILAGLRPEQRQRGHSRLAEHLERRQADPETVAAHLLGAGEPNRAARHVARAAADAAEALAFKRAARLYALALELVPAGSPLRQGLRVGLAEVLAHDGRSAEAATNYLAACREAVGGSPSNATPSEEVSLRRHAAEQLLRSGRIDEGTQQLRRVLDALELRYPADPRLALAGFVWQRANIRLRGMEFSERPASQVDPRLLLRIDTTWTAATGLQQANVIVGQYFQAQHLLLALEAGEPHRVARALGVEAIYAATSGSEGAPQVDVLLERVLGLARRLDDPRARAIAELAAGIADLYRGRVADARPHLERAEQLLRTQCTNVAWELSMVRTFLIMVLYYLGDFPVFERAMNEALDDAAERDDLHTALMIRMAFGPMPALAAGDPLRARAVLAECEAECPSQLQTSTYSYVRMLTRARLDRWARRSFSAWKAYEDSWPIIVRSLMLTKQPFRTFSLQERACSALWVAHDAAPPRRAAMLREAQANATTLSRQKTRWACAMGLSIAAVVSHVEGHHERALEQALAAERGLEELGMSVYAAAMAKRRGELQGGAAGASLVADAEARLRRAGIVATTEMTDMLVPPVLGW
jgi:eukaryotic-like serine/threonine-protein kinase